MFLDGVEGVFLATAAVLENECGDADAVQVAGRLDAFRVVDLLAVASARADHHRGARGLVLGREKGRDRRVVHVADTVILGNLRLVAPSL
jgi:hypothetical protein